MHAPQPHHRRVAPFPTCVSLKSSYRIASPRTRPRHPGSLRGSAAQPECGEGVSSRRGAGKPTQVRVLLRCAFRPPALSISSVARDHTSKPTCSQPTVKTINASVKNGHAEARIRDHTSSAGRSDPKKKTKKKMATFHTPRCIPYTHRVVTFPSSNASSASQTKKAFPGATFVTPVRSSAHRQSLRRRARRKCQRRTFSPRP